MSIDRDQHLKWCKDRALAYCLNGNDNEAVSSFVSDMGKHPETEGHFALNFIMHTLITGGDVKKFINDFN